MLWPMGHEVSLQTRRLTEADWARHTTRRGARGGGAPVDASACRRPFRTCIYAVLDAIDRMGQNQGFGDKEVTLEELERALARGAGFVPSTHGPTREFRRYLGEIGFADARIVLGPDDSTIEREFLTRAIEICRSGALDRVVISFS